MRNEYKITLENAEEIKECRKQVKDKMTSKESKSGGDRCLKKKANFRGKASFPQFNRRQKCAPNVPGLSGLRTHQQTKILLV